MKTNIISFLITLILAVFVSGCEKVNLGEEKQTDKEGRVDDKDESKGEVNDKPKACTIYVNVAPFTLTRGEAYTPTADKIAYALFDSIGRRCWFAEQTLGETKIFGTLNATMSAGTYRLLTIGHHTKGIETCTLDNVSFADGIPFDTYSRITEFTIGKGEEKTLDVAMDEITARLELCFPEGVPGNLRSVSVTYDKGNVWYNPQTSLAMSDAAKRDYFAASMFTPANKFTVSSYRFLTSAEETTNLEVAAVDTYGENIQTYSFSDVLLRRGETTRLEIK